MDGLRYKNGKPVIRGSADGSWQPAYADMTSHVAADRSDRTMASWDPPALSADADTIDELEPMVSRSRDLHRNNGIAAGGLQTYKDNIIGHTLRLRAKPHIQLLGWTRQDGDAWASNTEHEFETWSKTSECDAERHDNLLGLTLQALTDGMVNGAALAIPLWIPRNGSRWATRIMMIEADRLSTPPWLQHRRDIRGGVQRDRFGAPKYYYIQKQHPGDYAGIGYGGAIGVPEWERIPAFTRTGLPRVIHLHDKGRTGASRGKPVVASVMREFRMAGHYQTTELQAAIANSLIAAFLEADMGSEGLAEMLGQNPNETWKQSVEQYRAPLKGGAILPLPPGAKLSSHAPNRPNNAFGTFMESALRHISTGMHMPYELLMKDFSKTNYSSARAALLEAWRYFLGRRRWIKDHWLNPIYSLWMDEAVARDRVTAPDFHANQYAYTRCDWLFAGRGWVDPTKEANAAKIRMEAGISTLESECAEQGSDWEEVIEQRERERERMREAGLLEDAERDTSHLDTPGDDDRGAGNTSQVEEQTS